MSKLSNMPVAGFVVILVIAALFLLSVVLLACVFTKYRRISKMISGELDHENSFLRHTVNEFATAYKLYGPDTNTPAIIADSVGSQMGGLLFCERYLNNAVSLFVTLGLFGTFLGLSLSVSSLTELISFSNTSEWLSVLDSVGGGLMSALSGMGVAFYTSLVGVACSILLTILKAIFNPESERAKMETQLELWLDQTVAPTLPTRAAKDDATLVRQLIDGLNQTADSIEKTMNDTTAALKATLNETQSQLSSFGHTVNSFNNGVRDFSEFNYNLRGTVERLDVSVRDLVGAMREASRNIQRNKE